MRRQLRLGRGESVEEELRSARPAPHEAVAEPHPRSAEAVARRLVDRTRVEVLDECVPITVERVDTCSRQSSSDRVQCLLHPFVDSGAPVGEPVASPVLQLRVEQPFRDRSCRQVDDSERRPRRTAQSELGRRISGETDQLPRDRRGAPRGVPEHGPIGDCRKPELESRRRQRSVGVADQHRRADILFPQDLERRALGNDVGLDRFGCGHEPLRVRGAGEVTAGFARRTSLVRRRGTQDDDQ